MVKHRKTQEHMFGQAIDVGDSAPKRRVWNRCMIRRRNQAFAIRRGISDVRR
jgi:hypothetical protein